MDIVRRLADRLADAYDGPAIDPIAAELPAGDIDAAYAVQMAQVARWQAAGRRIAGRKIGITSLAVQRQLGVDTPDFGHVMADMVFGDGEILPYDRLQQPRVEAEVALILDHDLDLADATVADVVAATGWVLPALEIVGSRIADCASAGLVALGGPARRLDGCDLSGCAMTMTVNGALAAVGEGRACLGNPLNAAVWLARAAYRLGSPLRAGDLILTGALGPMAPVSPGDEVEASIEGLGSVQTFFSKIDQEVTA